MINKALKLCCQAHQNQTDKAGLPYYLHPIHLAYQMTDENTIVTALLHDIVEDTDYTIENLIDMGFPEEVCNAVRLLTHSQGDSYMDYIHKIKDNPIARSVKLADLRHNSDLSRLHNVTEQDKRRVKKYLKAIVVLLKAIEY